MKLIDYCNKYYLAVAKSDETAFEKRTRDRKARAECAASLGISRDYFNNLVSNNTHVVRLYDGTWMTLTKYNKRFT